MSFEAAKRKARMRGLHKYCFLLRTSGGVGTAQNLLFLLNLRQQSLPAAIMFLRKMLFNHLDLLLSKRNSIER